MPGRIIKKSIKLAKKEHFEETTTQTDSTSKIAKLVRSLNNQESNFLGLLKDPITGKFCDDPKASAKVLLEKISLTMSTRHHQFFAKLASQHACGTGILTGQFLPLKR